MSKPLAWSSVIVIGQRAAGSVSRVNASAIFQLEASPAPLRTVVRPCRKMKALMCRALGEDQSKQLIWEDVDAPNLESDQVLVRVMAASTNFPDTLIVQGRYQFKPALPFSPGGEVAGIVEAVGSDVDPDLGIAVVTASLQWSDGGFASSWPSQRKIMRMPASMDFASASAFPMVFGTSYYALKRRGRVKTDDVVLVLGAAGGVGLAAVQLAKAMGATGSRGLIPGKLALCRASGADMLINYKKDA